MHSHVVVPAFVLGAVVSGGAVDGTTRTSLGACLVFLRRNGVVSAPDGPGWEALTLAVAEGRIDRDATTQGLRIHLNAR